MKINRHIKASFYTTLCLAVVAAFIFAPAKVALDILCALMIVACLGAIVALYFVFLEPK